VKSVCVGNAVVQCVCRVPTYLDDGCVACLDGTSGENEAFCVESPAPDPSCPKGASGSYCSGTTSVRCRDGYVSSRYDCPPGDRSTECVTCRP
jgi:hypothetical protein